MTIEVSCLASMRSEDPNRGVLAAELDFYSSYDWCLNAYPSIGEVMRHLEAELSRYLVAEQDWRRDEIARNVYLLSCAILDTADDYLLGRRYSFSKVLGVFPALAPLTKLAQKALHAADARYWLSRQRVWNWRAKWEIVVNDVLQGLLLAQLDGSKARLSVDTMKRLLATKLPEGMSVWHPRIPAAFRSQDLTHFDVLSLGGKFIAAFPDRNRPILVSGLRTAGSYFAFLLRAYLESQGYKHVECVTMRPKAGVSRWEKARISRIAGPDCLAVIIDEPVGTGGTLGKGIAFLTKYGIPRSNVVVLFPVHRNGRGWKSNPDSEPICACHVFTLEHDEWYKHKLMQSSAPETLLREYLEARGWDVEVEEAGAEEPNACLKAVSEEKYHTRLKRVFAVRLTRSGESITRYVLAKSAGWGWLGYHAFLAGTRLVDCVPPIIGLRDGILYSEWITEQTQKSLQPTEMVRTLAHYVATRARSLGFGSGSDINVMRESQPARGLEELAGHLSGAYGKAAGILKRPRIKQKLAAMQSHAPTLIDGRMRPLEWVRCDGTMLKSDFEHHGLGKHQLNLTDPAYDLAESILHWNLSSNEERELLGHYIAETGDRDVYSRIFLHKLLAGRWWMDRALENLNDARMLPRHPEFNRLYIKSWNFLVLHTMQFCAGVCHKPSQVRWISPLAVLDVDGVIDKQVFGFPSTTMAGIQAISLLHKHGFVIALNTARSIQEVKEYCRAYGFTGGVAEYGAHVWDAVNDAERVLVSEESLKMLERLRAALGNIPGVFLNDDYIYSIRAYTYERGRSVPLPKILVQNVIAGLGLDGLTVHHTYMDTAILASETDKGRGMLELLQLAGVPGVETYAVGDSAPDLSMFRMAAHSFAPGHISCGAAARLLKCRVASHGYQAGLLECARAMLRIARKNGDGGIPAEANGRPPQERYLLHLLEIADRSPMASLIRALFDPMSLQTFIAE
jgi:hydroxymethylpyrimidine pyrophosphatase-like HAD family hydrolase